MPLAKPAIGITVAAGWTLGEFNPRRFVKVCDGDFATATSKLVPL